MPSASPLKMSMWAMAFPSPETWPERALHRGLELRLPTG